ncbi:hypothetical protein MPSEU_000550900 [Mayamaea pseudoterrestris]|nr:hypothetical protein MPSEU_000550900 [Mayamaea pseudoterrestris]
MPTGVHDNEKHECILLEPLNNASAAAANNDEVNGGGGNDAVHDAHVDGSDEDQGVEVVLGSSGEGDDEANHDGEGNECKEANGAATRPDDQNVFRGPVRPRVLHRGPPPPQQHHAHPYSTHGSGSWGYGPPHYQPQQHYHGDYPPPRAYPPFSYAPSNSFDASDPYRTSHYYSPGPPPQQQQYHQYPPSSRSRYSDHVNVISPHHLTPRPRRMVPPSHKYPPSSPVRRPSGRVRDYAISRRGQQPVLEAEWNVAQSPQAGVKATATDATTTTTTPRSTKQQQQQVPMVTDPSFESSQQPQHPATPSSEIPEAGVAPFYYGAPSWGSFDTGSLPPPPPQYHEQGYYGPPPPESPYSVYNMHPPAITSSSNYFPQHSSNLYYSESFPPPAQYGPNGSFSYSYDDHEDRMGQTTSRDYYHHHATATTTEQQQHSHPAKAVTPNASRKKKSGGTAAARDLLPKAAQEIDFDVASPPMQPIEPEGVEPLCCSLSDVNGYDVLCGRGGGTNSQIGNRRFRKLVQDFQPIYLLARRKEKPLLARTIVLIIRKRGGRFLKKDDETGEMFEVGDVKAEAKTSQALREGLDVRATKSAAGSLMDKKKKDKNDCEGYSPDDVSSPMSVDKETCSPTSRASSTRSPKQSSSLSYAATSRPQPESPPPLPRLVVEDAKSVSGVVHPHSPDQLEYRKRRRMRVPSDRFFPEFCPPRADLAGRPPSPIGGWNVSCGGGESSSQQLHHSASQDDDIRYHGDEDDTSMPDARGCAGAALDIVQGAVAASGFACLAPANWRR